MRVSDTSSRFGDDMQRRNFLMKILLAIPFVGLLAASFKGKPKTCCNWQPVNERFRRQVEGRIQRIGMPEAIDDYVHAGLTPKQRAFCKGPRERDTYQQAKTRMYGLLYGAS